MSTLPIFPPNIRGLTWPVLRTFEWATDVQKSPAFYENKLQLSSQPIVHYDMEFDYLKNDAPYSYIYSDYNMLLGFSLAMAGQYGDFLYNDPTLNLVGPAQVSGNPNPLARLQLVNDGLGHYYSPIQCHIGGTSGIDTASGFFLDVTDLQPNGGNDHSAFTLYANNVAQTYTTDYTISATSGLSVPGFASMGLYVIWTGTPTPPITANFNFFMRLQWEDDSQDIEQFMQTLFAIGGSHTQKGSGSLKFVSSRPTLV